MYLTVLSLLALFLLIRKLFSPNNRVAQLGNLMPGPPAYPIIGNSLTMLGSDSEEILKLWQRMIDEYGDVCRLWLANKLVVVLSDPSDCEAILRSPKYLDKSYVYEFLHPWLGTGLLTSTGEKWHRRRKVITPAFHFKILEDFIEIFNRNGSILIQCLKKNCGEKSFDVYPFISLYALDIICETAMGTKVDAQVNSSSSYVKAVRRICFLLAERIRKPWLHYNLIYKLCGMQSQVEKALKILHEQTNKVIQEKKEEIAREGNDKPHIIEECCGIKRKTAFLEMLLRMEDNTLQHDSDIREEVDTFMFEGHDTTTSAISFALSLLAKHPDVQERAYKELKNLLGEEKAQPTYEDLQQMKYLEMIIKESLRLFPSVPIVGRQIKEEVELPSGYTLPAGTLIAASIYFCHRNKNHYSNPFDFNPDNFLPDVSAQRHPYAYIPFSAGPRNCIGQKFAMAEIKVALSKIILNFYIETGENDSNVRPSSVLLLQSKNGHSIKLKLREN